MTINHVRVEIEHLHQHSVCDPALEILDEVHQWIRWAGRLLGPEKNHSFQSREEDLEQCKKHSQIVFVDCSMFLIG
jgi:hypothetical protein